MKRFIIRTLNYLLPKNNKSIVLTPHSNCATDNYDIFNPDADNVLCLFRYMLEAQTFEGYNFYLVIYNDRKLQQYKDYFKKYTDRSIHLVKDNTWAFVKGFLTSKIIVNATPYRTYSFKTAKQLCICLGYYTPFKNDFEYVRKMSVKKQMQYFKKMNYLFDYHITTSDFSSRILSSDFLLKYDKFLPLGFPRNDIFYDRKLEEKDRFVKSLCDILMINISKIIIYTPTYRDYESECNNIRPIFGSFCDNDQDELDKILEDNDMIIIAKLHPLQESSIIKKSSCKRVILYSDLVKEISTNLYQLLSISDALITDYTSTSFDYLHLGNPIIYYCYDCDLYAKSRGLAITPIESICAGHISYTPRELLNSIKAINNDEDNYADRRESLHQLINKHHDGCATQRIASLIESLANL